MAPPAAAPSDALQPGFVNWLLAAPAPAAGSPFDLGRALSALDAVLARPKLPADLLPRASSVVPQLIAMLQKDGLAVAQLADRISRDVLLMTEVLRLASSPLYRGQGEIVDLRHAIAVVGVSGVNSAIARVVLKPIFQGATGALSARAAPRLVSHADALAQHAAREAQRAGLPLFDGFLAGLLYDSGWTVLCRVLDRDGLAIDGELDPAQGAALASRAHGLFGLAAQGWDITPGFGAFAGEARLRPLAEARVALAAAVRTALPLAAAEVETTR